jgi:peptidoglycan/LPS O-acetylase OafA/YrhL
LAGDRLDPSGGITIQVMAKLLHENESFPQALQEKIAVRRPPGRNHQFDLLRILFATLVLLSHAPEVTDGNRSRELLHRLTGAPITFGMLAVDGFFVLSGYLIVQSWLVTPELLDFLRKRVLRIVPGYLVAVALSTLAVGLLAPGVSHFFRHLDVHFLVSIVLLTSPATPPVFPGQWYSVVNGAMYTIAYEFRCYLLVALLGLCGLLRRPLLVLIAALVFLSSLLYMEPFERMHWPRHVEALIGLPSLVFQLTAAYLVGVCFHLFRERVTFRPLLALAAVALFAAVIVFAPGRAQLALVLCGSYLTFYFGQMRLPSLSAMDKIPDISYGVYLYGSPVECLWIWFHRGSPWVTFFASTIICFGLGWLSWHFIERPALTLKRRASAKLPAP